MSFYQKISKVGQRFLPMNLLFKYGFNLSPMYRRTTARIVAVHPDLMHIEIKLAKSYRNVNIVGTIFGGSMFAAVDPIPMTQLMQLLGDQYVVWDKAAQINFKRPASQDLYASFTYTNEEITDIKEKVAQQQEIEIVKTTVLTNASRQTIFCEVIKTIYIANKSYYKQKIKQKKKVQAN